MLKIPLSVDLKPVVDLLALADDGLAVVIEIRFSESIELILHYLVVKGA